MKVKLSFVHQHVKRYGGTTVVEPEPLGEFEIIVSMSHRDADVLENEMDRDFRLLPRVEQSNIVFANIDYLDHKGPSQDVKKVSGGL